MNIQDYIAGVAAFHSLEKGKMNGEKKHLKNFLMHLHSQ